MHVRGKVHDALVSDATKEKAGKFPEFPGGSYRQPGSSCFLFDSPGPAGP